jgi:hypothetical protein
MKIGSLREVAYGTIASLIIACVAYFLNFGLFSSNSRISPSDASFLEGLFLIIIGSLLFLGSGGMNRATQRAALFEVSFNSRAFQCHTF